MVVALNEIVHMTPTRAVVAAVRAYKHMNIRVYKQTLGCSKGKHNFAQPFLREVL